MVARAHKQEHPRKALSSSACQAHSHCIIIGGPCCPTEAKHELSISQRQDNLLLQIIKRIQLPESADPAWVLFGLGCPGFNPVDSSQASGSISLGPSLCKQRALVCFNYLIAINRFIIRTSANSEGKVVPGGASVPFVQYPAIIATSPVKVVFSALRFLLVHRLDLPPMLLSLIDVF